MDRPPVVLVADDDQDIGVLLQAVLSDESYQVVAITATEPAAVAAAVGRVEPDCLLLDSGSARDYGQSWEVARALAERPRRVPVIMFTGDLRAIEEAQAHQSARSVAADFAGILLKPFDLDDLSATVAAAVATSVPFNHSPVADAARTAALVERLRAGGARDISAGTRREWVTFRAPSGRLVQLYWWQRRGVYYCGSYDEESAALQLVGFFSSLDAAVARALAG